MKIKSLILGVSAGMLLAGVSTGLGQTPITILNPSFETPVNSGTVTFQQGAGTSTYGNWTAAEVTGIASFLGQNSATPGNEDGNQLFEAFSVPAAPQYAGEGTLYQELSTTWLAGASYTLTAYAGNVSGQSTMTGCTFSLDSISGSTLTTLATVAISSATTGSLAQYTLNYTATGLEGGNGDIVVAFNSPAQSGSAARMWVDNFALTVTPVPEPGTLALAAMGGFGMLVLYRRRAA
jgi:hypothetical protein